MINVFQFMLGKQFIDQFIINNKGKAYTKTSAANLPTFLDLNFIVMKK
jgi:hypothetical protein